MTTLAELLKDRLAGVVLFVVCLIGASLGVQAPAHAQSVGVVASVQSRLDGTPPGGAAAPKALGASIVLDERLVSSASGGGQILFDDQSSLSIAPGSDVLIDRYVYDPSAGAGEIGLSLAKGAMRFIGGRITKQNDAMVRTPTASLAIRGGIALIDLRGGVLRVIHIAGERTEITLPNGETLSLSREGGTAEVRPTEGGGFEIVFLGVSSPEEIESAYSAVQGGSGDEAFSLGGTEETAITFDEPGGVFRGPVSTSGAEPQGGTALEPEILIQQVELGGSENGVLEVMAPAETPVFEEVDEEEEFEFEGGGCPPGFEFC